MVVQRPIGPGARICTNVFKRFARMSTVAAKELSVRSDVNNRGPKIVKSVSDLVVLQHDKKVKRLNEAISQSERKRLQNLEQISSERRKLISAIEKVVCSSRSRFVIAGSLSTSLFDEDTSDIDVCFFPLMDDDQKIAFYDDFFGKSHFREQFLWTLRDMIVNDPNIGGSQLDIGGCEVVPNDVWVPIITIKYKNGLSIDIQFPRDGHQSIRNTNLMRYYQMADVRFGPVYFWLRSLFKALGIRKSKEGLFSSYHILCLVTHFLQSSDALSSPVVPVLCNTHDHLVGPKLPIEKVIKMLDRPLNSADLKDWKSSNEMSVGELGVRLVEYYKNFKVNDSAIFLADGNLHPKQQRDGQRSTQNYLEIFDPFSEKDICRRAKVGGVLLKAMNFVMSEMKNGRLIDSFPDFPEAEYFEKKLLLFKPWTFRKVQRPILDDSVVDLFEEENH